MLKDTLKQILKTLGLAEQIRLIRDRRSHVISDFDDVFNTLHAFKKEPRSSSGRVAILPAAAAPGGLGDEALIKGLLAMLKDQGVEIATIAVVATDKWDFLPEPEVTLPQTTEEWGDFGKFLQTMDWVYIIGADIMDGAYGLETTGSRIKLAHAANAMDIGATITGFSFNDRCPTALIELYKKLGPKTSICLRDPFSKQRFEEKTGKKSTLVADLAFSMPPNYDSMKTHDYHEWIENSKKSGRKLLGLNICPHTAHSDYGKRDVTKLLPQLNLYLDAVSKFLMDHLEYDVLLIPHDYRGMLSDLNMSLILANQLKLKVGKSRVNVVDDWINADEIKAAAQQMSFVLTGRMHLAIASLGSGTPAACFTYQNKFEGLFELLSLPMDLLSSIPNSTVDSIYNTLCNLNSNEELYRRQISEKSNLLHDLSIANISHYLQHKA